MLLEWWNNLLNFFNLIYNSFINVWNWSFTIGTLEISFPMLLGGSFTILLGMLFFRKFIF